MYIYINKIEKLFIKNGIAEKVINSIMDNELDKNPNKMDTNIVDFCLGILNVIKGLKTRINSFSFYHIKRK